MDLHAGSDKISSHICGALAASENVTVISFFITTDK